MRSLKYLLSVHYIYTNHDRKFHSSVIAERELPYVAKMYVVVIVALLAEPLWMLATGKCPPINSGLISLL